MDLIYGALSDHVLTSIFPKGLEQKPNATSCGFVSDVLSEHSLRCRVREGGGEDISLRFVIHNWSFERKL